MESALDVLSRAATMVQDNANETRLTSKELPTTVWRRERRLRTGEYNHPHHHSSSASGGMGISSPSASQQPTVNLQHSIISSATGSDTNANMRSSAHHLSIMMAAAASMCPLSEPINHVTCPSPPPHSNLPGQIHFSQISHSQVLHQINSVQNDDGPLDMSVGNLKQRNSPPPPYREPLPGSQFASSLARPSVITQAPPKRDARDSILVTNRDNDNRSCESIDEHFRRSLGNDYFSLFSKRSPANQVSKTPSPQPHNSHPPTAHRKSSSPTSPISTAAPTLIQSETNPPPAYPVPSGHLKQSKANNMLLSPVTLAAQMNSAAGPNSPPLPLVVRSNVLQSHKHSHVLQKPSSLLAVTPLTYQQSPPPNPGVKSANITQSKIYNTSGSRTASPLPLQQQSPAVVLTLSHMSSIDNSPSSSPCDTPPVPSLSVPNSLPNLSTTMRIKAEPGLQNVKSNNPTPPASPTSTANQYINSNNSSNISSPSSPKCITRRPSTNSTNTTTEVLASVDDHFAKALGDTWKKLQKKREMRK